MRILCLCGIMSLLLCAGCQRNIMVPTPPDSVPIVTAIAQSNIPAEQKADAIERALRVMRDMYDAELRRASEMGDRVKLSWDDFLKQAVYVGGLIWATK